MLLEHVLWPKVKSPVRRGRATGSVQLLALSLEGFDVVVIVEGLFEAGNRKGGIDTFKLGACRDLRLVNFLAFMPEERVLEFEQAS